MNDQEKVKIFDTTLRDGEQSPGASMNLKEKVEIARQLDLLGVDIIEAGFPAASPGDFESVSMIAKETENATICGLARCLDNDIQKVAESTAAALNKRIHVFLATSNIHRKFKFNKPKEEIIKLAIRGVEKAKSFVDDVEFSPEDATRTELSFLAEIVEAVIKAGATTVNIPDTVGYTTPSEMTGIIQYLKKNVSCIDQAIISVHCHDDLGMSVANSLAAVDAGARQIECTINGIGERAGNCSLEEVVMALKTRQDLFNFQTNIMTKEICKTSRMVSHITGITVPSNKAIVGANAFAHESGVHQDGVLKNRETYEIMDPQDVGWGESELVLGKHSGRHAFEKRLISLGYELEKDVFEEAFHSFKVLSDKKKTIYNQDLVSIVENFALQSAENFSLVSVEMNYLREKSTSEPSLKAKVTIKDLRSGELLLGESSGEGPVEAIFEAINRALKVSVKVFSYSIKSVTEGQDAMGEVAVKLTYNDSSPKMGRAASVDVLEASAQAFLYALNLLDL
ncbi:2-isopropylmalate synthase [PVC group bacterium (ex Bugula neritina AB1)]|nr:2-isopropylmalate synthase [PVC group bacterium (ex Bugula neritina AB1)]